MRKFLTVLCGSFLLSGAGLAQTPFYDGKTLSLIVNYGAGGNVDTDARIMARHITRYVPGRPTIIIQNAPGAGGALGMNMLALNINSKPDGLTGGFFTVSPVEPLVESPTLKFKMDKAYVPIGGLRGWTIAYARVDSPPGLKTPADIAKATRMFTGGYSRAASHDTRMRLALEVMNVPYTPVTGFPTAGDINKALIQNEINMTASSLPAYRTQVVPNIITPGIGMPLWYYDVIGEDGKSTGNPALDAQGLETYSAVYQKAFGKPPSGDRYEALLQVNNIATKLQRGFFLPAGSPPEAVAALRTGFEALRSDSAYLEDYERVNQEKPDMTSAAEVAKVLDLMGKASPSIKKILLESISE
jgi:tripartite-type tricarboxylate transporter receptor subunit TctC